MIAALFVETNGVYFGLPNVDPWDEKRDARLYDGPWPVVAHPPCSRWCQLAGLVKARYGYEIGDDGGCFASALASVRKWGGVLEHPAYTKAWRAYDLPNPLRDGWIRTLCGGWVCQVAQSHYGHRARKATWLYAYGIDPKSLVWGDGKSEVWMTWLKRDGQGREMNAPSVERMGKRERNASPVAFRDMLIALAESATVNPHATPPANR